MKRTIYQRFFGSFNESLKLKQKVVKKKKKKKSEIMVTFQVSQLVIPDSRYSIFL